METATTTVTEIQAEERYLQKVEQIRQQVQTLEIKDYDQYQFCQGQLEELKRVEKEVGQFFDPGIAKAYEAHQYWCKKKKRIVDALTTLYKSIKQACIAFDDEQERKRREQERIAEAKRQEEERKKREALEAQAQKARDAGKVEKAEALEEKAANVYVPPTFTPPPAAPVKQVAARTHWTYEVTNMRDLCRSVADGKIPPTVLTVAPAEMNAHAKAFKNFVQVPGVRFIEKKV